MSEDWLGLKDKVAIVTGGASGIGLNIANELKNQGVHVVIGDVNFTSNEQRNGFYQICCDVTKRESVQQLVEKTVQQFGTIDILVNNAGINYPRLLVDDRGEKPQYELSEKDFDKMVSINQKGTYLCSQEVAKVMIKNKKEP